jgi:hypothetical protein
MEPILLEQKIDNLKVIALPEVNDMRDVIVRELSNEPNAVSPESSLPVM